MCGLTKECYGCADQDTKDCPIYSKKTRETKIKGKKFEKIKKNNYPCYCIWSSVL